MNKKSRTKPTTSLLGMAGFAMVIAACDQASDASGLVEAADDGSCIVTRLAAASPDNMDAGACSPCAAACNPCNPCAAACNPCAAACNPCAAACNPCNPCAAACNPCAAKACNPCAAKACNPCNPCAGANPCNPCAGANPCNPCAAASNPCGGCNPCNPCGPAGNWDAPELNADELSAAYDCLKASMAEHYAMAAEPGAADYQGWRLYNTSPYTSGTHGGRYVNNYSNGVGAREYAKYEDVGTMPVGSILAKDSFTIDAHGNAKAGPLFLMEKMEDGFNAESGNWKYTLINADGTTWGVTNGKNSGGMQFCIDCHIAAEDFDHLFFLPDEYRAE